MNTPVNHVHYPDRMTDCILTHTMPSCVATQSKLTHIGQTQSLMEHTAPAVVGDPTKPTPINKNDIQSCWQVVQNKKRKVEARKHSQVTISKGSKITKAKNNVIKKTVSYPTPTVTQTTTQTPVLLQNRFDNLEMDAEEQQPQIPNKPQPIIIPSVHNINMLFKLLDEVAADKYEYRTLGINSVKIQPVDIDTYRLIQNKLNNKDIEYNTFQLKKDRSFRVAIRHLHPSTKPDAIAEELKGLGHMVTQLPFNVRHRITKEPLPLFFVDLVPDANNKDIYELERLQKTVVTVEPIRKKKEVVQCKRCQRYGHTAKYCRRAARCVKCTGDHLTTNCDRTTRDNTVQCVNCNMNHPANYRGCEVYKRAWIRRYQPDTRPSQHQTNTTSSIPFENQQRIRKGTSYAAVTRKHEIEDVNSDEDTTNIQTAISPQTDNSTTDIMHMLKEMKSLMCEQTKQINILLSTLNTLLQRI